MKRIFEKQMALSAIAGYRKAKKSRIVNSGKKERFENATGSEMAGNGAAVCLI
jgi:hypothetical protein